MKEKCKKPIFFNLKIERWAIQIHQSMLIPYILAHSSNETVDITWKGSKDEIESIYCESRRS